MDLLRLFAAVTVVTAISACSSGFIKPVQSRLEIQQGPLTAVNPALVLGITSKWTNNEGTIQFTRPDGAACTGRWSLVQGRQPKRPNNIRPEILWGGSGTVAKDGYLAPMGDGSTKVSHGDRRGLALGTGDCSNGTVFRFSFVANGMFAKGALRDSEGNLFRFIR